MAAAEARLGAPISAEAKEQAEDAKAKAAVKVAELQLQWNAANADLQQRLDAVTSAREAATAAETARAAAAEAARQAERELQPISVLISRKTQRLYIRQAFKPILETPVTIADPDRPIGTHVFTAIERSTDDANLRWSAVSLGGGRPPSATVEPHDGARANSGRDAEPVPTDPGSAKAALDRISIPQDALDRIGNIMPRSSLIVTDEALSPETGKGTEFVVLLSGEPQGGIEKRRRSPGADSATRAHAARLFGARRSEVLFLPRGEFRRSRAVRTSGRAHRTQRAIGIYERGLANPACCSIERRAAGDPRCRYSLRGCMVSFARMFQAGTASVLLLAAVQFTPALADDGFPFGTEMTLDVGRQPGSKRIPNLEIGDTGEVMFELWCKGGKGQFSVAGNTVIFVAGEMENRACPPDRAQQDDDLIAALTKPAPGSGRAISCRSSARRHCGFASIPTKASFGSADVRRDAVPDQARQQGGNMIIDHDRLRAFANRIVAAGGSSPD